MKLISLITKLLFYLLLGITFFNNILCQNLWNTISCKLFIASFIAQETMSTVKERRSRSSRSIGLMKNTTVLFYYLNFQKYLRNKVSKQMVFNHWIIYPLTTFYDKTVLWKYCWYHYQGPHCHHVCVSKQIFFSFYF